MRATTLGGVVLGLAFARYTTSRWVGGRPSHVWPSEVEFAYAAVELALWWSRHRTATEAVVVAS